MRKFSTVRNEGAPINPVPWLTVVRNQSAPKVTELMIQGSIGKDWFDDSGTSEKEFTDALKSIPEDHEIIVGINSQGGSVKDGLGIYNALLRRGEKVTTRNDGYAVSIASVIMLAGNKRISPKSSLWMIHRASMLAMGNAEDMEKAATALREHDKTIASVYADRTGMKEADALEKMGEETWFRGDEAVEMGFATEVSDEQVALNSIDFSKFRNVPKDVLKVMTAPVQGGAHNNQPKGNTVNRAQKIALLNSWGVTVPDDISDADLDAKVAAGKPTTQPANNQPAAPAPQAAPTPANVIELSPASVEAIVGALRPVVNPLPPGTRVENLGNPGRNAIAAKPQGRSRFEFIRDNWNDLAAGGIPLVRNANTMDSTALTTDMLASGLIVVLQNRLANLQAFSRDFGTDRLKPTAKVQVPIATAGGTAQSNATSFEDTTNFVGTIDNVEIAPARITSGAHITAAELNNGFRMAQFVTIKAHELADKIQSLVNAVITTTNFDRTTELGAAALVAAFTAFGKSDLDAVWAAIEKSSIKNVMLAGGYYKNFLPATLESFNPLASNSLPGWDGFYHNSYWTGAETNTRGFACNPQAIAVASGLPLASPNRGMTTAVQAVTLPGIGLTIEQQEWYSTSTKTDWMNWEVMFGAAKGDPAAGCLIKIG